MSKRKFPLTAEQAAWFAETHKPERANPCLRVFGNGPEGKTCKTCALLWRTGRSRIYLKCGLRNNTHGKATDHKAGWAACAKYEEATQ